MLALSLVFLGILVTPVLDERLTAAEVGALNVAEVVLWVVFAAEYLIRLVLTQDRARFLLHNIPDLVAVAVPVLRPVRVVRLARFVRAGALVARTAEHAQVKLYMRVAVQATVIAVLVLFVGSVGMFDVERHAPNANIRTFGDAAWWAITTVTTVGYGDRYPVTTEGRLIAVSVMLTGIAILGVVTASIASWFVENLRAVQRAEEQQAVRDQRLETVLTELIQRLAKLESHLGLSTSHDDAPDDATGRA